MKIFVRPKASVDLDEQALFIARDNPRIAYQLYETCEETLKRLAEMPHMGQLYPTTKKRLMGIRFFPIPGFERHLIFYIPLKDRIDIVRILYTTRDITRILK
jgi:toxin ParE1/3/4